ncbi:MAG TPA: protein translocase subunit SecF [Candidatus Deferrimicrobium sp.]|nr:protein translocase subunit SecF [Candidatus Deferrimicrobium sp.]
MFSLIGVPKIDFIAKRKVSFALSSVIVLVGLFALLMIMLGKAEMGIDFSGGVMMQGHFASEVRIDHLRDAISAEFPDAQVNEVKDFSVPHAFIIKTKRPETEAEGKERAKRILEIISSSFPGNTFAVDSENIIGPAVGQQLRKDATWAILLSILGILVYIGLRFDYRSGVAATVAMIHDVLAVVGIFYLIGIEFDLLVVSALLTLAGYSLTDKVVVYDRIRENLRKFRGKAEFVPCVNRSINETLSRTINTSTTVVVVVVMVFFGGATLKNFALALALGVLIGTYSSIFVASPIIVEWEARRPKRFK